VLDRFNGRAQSSQRCGLSEFANTPAVEMPYGRKRALEIATTLALDPEMMLLDEPSPAWATRTSTRSQP
jgi:branched-chain amino acid transport system ATP-binding protein